MDTTSEVDPADTLVRVFVRSVEAHASRPAVAELILLTASGPDLASERPRSESAGSHLQAT